MATKENYLKAKLEEVENSKREIEFELFRLKQEGTIALAAEMEAMKTQYLDTMDAAAKEIRNKDATIADLQKQLANEKQYSSNLKSTNENLKEAGTHKSSQMNNAKKTASTKSQAAKETIKKLQDELYERSLEVVDWRTKFKRADIENKFLRGNLETTEAAGVKRKAGDDGGAPKKRFTHDESSGDEDDEEPLKNLWQRKTAAATAGLANIKLEKED